MVQAAVLQAESLFDIWVRCRRTKSRLEATVSIYKYSSLYICIYVALSASELRRRFLPGVARGGEQAGTVD